MEEGNRNKYSPITTRKIRAVAWGIAYARKRNQTNGRMQYAPTIPHPHNKDNPHKFIKFTIHNLSTMINLK